MVNHCGTILAETLNVSIPLGENVSDESLVFPIELMVISYIIYVMIIPLKFSYWVDFLNLYMALLRVTTPLELYATN